MLVKSFTGAKQPARQLANPLYMIRKHLIRTLLFSSILAIGLFLAFQGASAQSLADQINSQIGAGANAAEIGRAVPPQIIVAEMIKISLTFVGTIFMALIIYGGYLLIADRGEGDRFERGKKTISAAILGVFIVLMAYGITLFVGRSLMANVYGSEYRNTNLKVKCSVIKVIQGKGCDSVQRN